MQAPCSHTRGFFFACRTKQAAETPFTSCTNSDTSVTYAASNVTPQADIIFELLAIVSGFHRARSWSWISKFLQLVHL